MKKFINSLRQLKRVFSDGYPTVHISTRYWIYSIKDGRVVYNNFRTLVSYIRG